MALLPVKFFWPFSIDPGATIQFTIEDEIQTAKAVFSPKLRLYNTSGVDVHLTIEHLLDLGFGDDPLYSGTYTYTVVDEDIPPSSMRDYEPGPQIDLDLVAPTRHIVKVTNTDTVSERVVRFILFGTAEIMAELPADQQIVRIRSGS